MRRLAVYRVNLRLAVAAIACAGLAASCGGGGPPATSDLKVFGADFAFIVDKAPLAAGTAHISFADLGTTAQHQFWLYPKDQPQLQELVRRKQAGEDVNVRDYLTDIVAGADDVPLGQTWNFNVAIKPGVYEIACFATSQIDGETRNHYPMMHTTITVNPS